MKSKILYFLALTALFAGWFSCVVDLDGNQDEVSQEDYSVWVKFEWDDSKQQEDFRPKNQGTDSAWFAIDNNIISFAVPFLFGTRVTEHIPTPNYGGPNAFSPYVWTISLILNEGVETTKLDPIITLTPGATITLIEHAIGSKYISEKVNYSGIVEVGAINFSKQVNFTIKVLDGSTITYSFLAVALGDLLPCVNCD